MLQKSAEDRSPSETGDDTQEDRIVNVLVTGFGPFRDAPTSNPSISVAQALPTVLSRTAQHPSRIRLFVRPEPVLVSYDAIYQLVPAIFEEGTTYHVVLHIGLASNRTYYALEALAYRFGFSSADTEGVEGHAQLQPYYWRLCPARLHTPANTEDVLRRWQNDTQGLDVRVSHDAGRYLCEYLYYASLAFFHHTDNFLLPWHERTTVAFMHIPAGDGPQDIENGTKAAIGLIYALVNSRSQQNGGFDVAPV